MRRIGLIWLGVGLAGFLLVSSQRARLDSVEGSGNGTPSASANGPSEGWETARWLLAGMAVIGLVFTILPGEKS